MKPEDQRIAILKACGWTCASWEIHQMPYWKNPKGKAEAPPDPVHDLNAMREAENIFSIVECEEYAGRLGYTRYNAAHASATEKAEAFLRTIGKWTD